MADPVATQLATGTSTTATTTVSFTAQSAGTLLVLIVGADDYRATTGTGRPESTGWTLPTSCAQEANAGHYMWYLMAGGSETSVQYKINSASGSVYWLGKVTNIAATSFLDGSNGATTPGGNSGTGASVTTSSGGRRIAIASFCTASGGAVITDHNTWTNSYTEIGENVQTVGTQDRISIANLVLEGGSATSTGATFSGGSCDTQSNIIAVFKNASSPDALVTPAAVAAVAAVPAATVQISRTVTPSAVAGVAAVPTATVTTAGNALVTPSVVAAVAAVNSAAVQTGANVTVSVAAVAAVAAVPSPTNSTGTKTTPAAVAGVAAVPSPAKSTSSVISPSTVAAVATVPVMDGATGTALDAVTVPAVAAVPTPTIQTAGNTIVAPAKVSAVAAVPAPTVTAIKNATVTAVAVAAVAAVPAPTVTSSTGSTVTPASVTAVAAVGSPTVSGSVNATVTPTVVAATANVLAPTTTFTSQVYIFRTPTNGMRYDSKENRLLHRFSFATGYSVLKENGFYRQVQGPSDEEIAAADITYLGGREHRVSQSEYDNLVAAGYGSYITVSQV